MRPDIRTSSLSLTRSRRARAPTSLRRSHARCPALAAQSSIDKQGFVWYGKVTDPRYDERVRRCLSYQIGIFLADLLFVVRELFENEASYADAIRHLNMLLHKKAPRPGGPPPPQHDARKASRRSRSRHRIISHASRIRCNGLGGLLTADPARRTLVVLHGASQRKAVGRSRRRYGVLTEQMPMMPSLAEKRATTHDRTAPPKRISRALLSWRLRQTSRLAGHGFKRSASTTAGARSTTERRWEPPCGARTE